MATIGYQFVDKADDSLICIICLEVARDPKQEENCGKLFCRQCIEKIRDNTCPSCRTETPKYFEDKKSYREIQELKVKCSNTKYGCDWIGPLRAASDHVTKSCDITLVNCKYKDIGCKEKHTKKRMREHEKDTSIHFTLAMDTVKKLKQSSQTASGDGITVKVTNYTTKKNNNECFKSDPFYTHHNGYKLRLQIWPNGVKKWKNNSVSVGVKLLKGPYDDSLSWPFEATITVQLLNQNNDDEHYGKKMDLDDEDDIYPPNNTMLHFRHTKVNPSLISTWSRKYVKNDTLYVNVKVKCDKHKYWLDVFK